MDLNKIILTTEDNVTIREGDAVWLVRNLNEEPVKTIVYDYMQNMIAQKGLKYVYFSTKQLADEYVFNNRKIYSRKEVDELLKSKK